jgi:hypothetical protein
MDNASEFNLNASIRFWLERLSQSPNFREENVAEMETHVRDSIVRLQSQGLSAEESFLIAIRRVGNVERLETEFGKVNRSPRNRVIHLLILVLFSIGCWFLWGTLKVAVMTGVITGGQLPAFSRLLIGMKDLLAVPPLAAAIYCLFFFLRKENSRSSWVGFFAATAGFLILLALPVAVAVYLPLIDALNHLGGK